MLKKSIKNDIKIYSSQKNAETDGTKKDIKIDS